MAGKGFLENILHTAHGQGGIHLPGKQMMIAFAVINGLFFFLDPGQAVRNYLFLLFFAPLWLPIMLYKMTFFQWLMSNRAAYIARQKTVLLEIRLPREVMKSPAAMEAVLSMMHQGSGEATWWKVYVLGQVRPWFSLEIASLGGRVHFFVWTRESMRRAVESAFYGQYPEVEIIEVEDYTRLIDPSQEPYRMAGYEYLKPKEDMVFPIRTWEEYGLQPGQKPEEQVDPLAQVIELLGALGPHEQLWVQLIIRTHKNDTYPKKDGRPQNWKDIANQKVEEIREGTVREQEYTDPITGKVTKTKGFPNPTFGQTEGMKAAQINTSKHAFDVGMRAIYTAPEDYYQGIMGGYLTSLFKPFSNAYMSLSVAERWSNYYSDYPWEDPSGHHQAELNRRMVEFIRRRAFFHAPYIGQWNVMSITELASLFHIPSGSIATPGLGRIQSTTSGAPTNLPS